MDKKKTLCSEVAASIRKVQKQYMLSKRSSDSNTTSEQELQVVLKQLSRDVEFFCGILEAVFLHELKNGKGILWRNVRMPYLNIPPEPSFWQFIDPMVPDEIRMQLLALRNSESDVRKCRSWVRLMMAKNLFISFMEDLQRHPGLLASHYEGGALLRDLEQSEIVVQLLRGVAVLPLDYDYANSKLDTWDSSVLELARVWKRPDGVVKYQGNTVPLGVPHSQSSSSRVSPPTSDFNFEGISIIDTALDRCRRKASASSFSDSQLISQEIAEQINSTTSLVQQQPRKQVSMCSSSSSLSLIGQESDGQNGRSYGAMLLDYAKTTETSVSGTSGLPTYTCKTVENPSGVLQNGNGNEGCVGERNRDARKDGEVGQCGASDGMEYLVALSLNYEIISSDGSFVESMKYHPHQQQKSIMMEHLVKLVNEKAMDSQKYRCAGCQTDIGLIIEQTRLCKFNGQHYCYDCHRNDQRVIPARVLFNWDFRLHKVCLASCEFLDSVELNPVLDVKEMNNALYRYIPALEEAMKLRLQIRHLKDYLVACKDHNVLENFRKRLQSSHIYDDIHKYSMKDLLDVNSGTFNERLKKLVKFGKKHVKQCLLCSQKGFVCEICHDPQVIYPFDLEDTLPCSACKSVYHKLCHPEKGSCPKCLRLRRRADSLSNSS